LIIKGTSTVVEAAEDYITPPKSSYQDTKGKPSHNSGNKRNESKESNCKTSTAKSVAN
jgi:hypothetical protein